MRQVDIGTCTQRTAETWSDGTSPCCAVVQSSSSLQQTIVEQQLTISFSKNTPFPQPTTKQPFFVTIHFTQQHSADTSDGTTNTTELVNELTQVIGVTTDVITVPAVTIQGNTEVADVVLRAPDTVDVVTVINTNKDSFSVLHKIFYLQRRLISIISGSLLTHPTFLSSISALCFLLITFPLINTSSNIKHTQRVFGLSH